MSTYSYSQNKHLFQNKYLNHAKSFFTKTMTIGAMISIGLITGCQKPANQPINTNNQTGEQNTPSSSSSDNHIVTNLDVPTVYATTNVWGAVAKAVGGDKVNVIVGVNDLSQDPHDYQASANDKLNINKSAIVLVNGGGYDDWGVSLAQSVNNKPVIINAVQLSGLQPDDHEHDHDHENNHEHDAHDHDEHAKDHDHAVAGHHHSHTDFNEHLFFSLDTAKKVAEAVNNQLAAASPSNKAIYAQNTQQFIQEIDRLKTKAKQAMGQKQVTAFATEPVVGYLLADMGIKDVTPKAYVEQSETDAGVSVKVFNDSKNMLSKKQVGVLIVNAQTEDNTSKQLVDTANAANIPVIAVYETFPQGVDSYAKFIENTIDDFATALK